MKWMNSLLKLLVNKLDKRESVVVLDEKERRQLARKKTSSEKKENADRLN